ncbi:hypothetical protein, partial [Pseudomonas protegens]
PNHVGQQGRMSEKTGTQNMLSKCHSGQIYFLETKNKSPPFLKLGKHIEKNEPKTLSEQNHA